MKMACTQLNIWLPSLGCVAIALLTACPVVGHYSGTTTQETFRADQVAKIERNRTTKRQVIEWFGPPRTIARKGEPSDYFKMFSATQPISDDSTIYFYRNVSRTASETAGGVILVPVPGGGVGGTLARSTSDEGGQLWILFDERTGLVRDYIVRSASER